MDNGKDRLMSSDSPGPLLLSPGPVHVAPGMMAGLEEMHHRTAPFREIVLETCRMISGLTASSGKVFLLTMSGSGAMESAIVNLTEPGARVLVVSGGKFGDRWTSIADRFGCRCDTLRFEEGKRIDPALVAERVRETTPDLVCFTHVESSTGLLVEIKDILELLPDPRPLIVLDAIASIVSEELKMDQWGIDLIVGAGQKGLAAPPGVSFVISGKRAEHVWRGSGRHAHYMSYREYDRGSESGDTPFTPAVQAIQILHSSLSGIFEEGPENVRMRHLLYSQVYSEALRVLGLEPFPEVPSASVLASRVPECFDAGNIVRSLFERRKIVIAGGQGCMEGKIIRTGFLGIHRPHIVRALVEGIADSLGDKGLAVDRSELELIIASIDECEHPG